MPSGTLRSFPPIVDGRSRVLILGSMPGPESLRRRQYYAFPRNQFWDLIAGVLRLPPPRSYPARVRMLRGAGIALWDALAACSRRGALDGSIVSPRLNDVPGLLRRRPNLRAVFVNGRGAQRFLGAHGEGKISLPVFYLPSSSPAHAGMGLAGKRRSWSRIRKWLKN